MPTESGAARPAALFLFPHQDDEFGVFQCILDELAAGRRVVCAYLTTGARAGASPAVRNAESVAVLSDLGVATADIVFAGEALGIDDAALPANARRARDWLATWFSSFDDLRAAYIPAWEGGHQDHDALHAAAVSAALERGIVDRLRQFALYNAWRCPAPFFRVLKPLPANGAAIKTAMPWRNRFRFLRHCLSYPSQWKSWVGLLPFVVLRYAFDGKQAVQHVDPGRLAHRPHEGALLYEARGFYQWEAMRSDLQAL